MSSDRQTTSGAHFDGPSGMPTAGARYGRNRDPESVEIDETREYPADCCQHCGEPVSLRFRLVMGDNDDVVHGCLDCTDITALRSAAGDPSYDRSDRTAQAVSTGAGQR